MFECRIGVTVSVYDLAIVHELARVEIPGREEIPAAILRRAELLSRHHDGIHPVPDIDAGRLVGFDAAAARAAGRRLARVRVAFR